MAATLAALAAVSRNLEKASSSVRADLEMQRNAIICESLTGRGQSSSRKYSQRHKLQRDCQRAGGSFSVESERRVIVVSSISAQSAWLGREPVWACVGLRVAM